MNSLHSAAAVGAVGFSHAFDLCSIIEAAHLSAGVVRLHYSLIERLFQKLKDEANA